jgi:hypothetical protein
MILIFRTDRDGRDSFRWDPMVFVPARVSGSNWLKLVNVHRDPSQLKRQARVCEANQEPAIPIGTAVTLNYGCAWQRDRKHNTVAGQMDRLELAIWWHRLCL